MWLACSSARATALKPFFSLLPSKARSMESLCSSLTGIAMVSVLEVQKPRGRSSGQLEILPLKSLACRVFLIKKPYSSKKSHKTPVAEVSALFQLPGRAGLPLPLPLPITPTNPTPNPNPNQVRGEVPSSGRVHGEAVRVHRL